MIEKQRKDKTKEWQREREIKKQTCDREKTIYNREKRENAEGQIWKEWEIEREESVKYRRDSERK